MKFLTDKYSLKARLYPSFITLLPLIALAFYYVTEIQNYIHLISVTVVSCGIIFLIAQLGRDLGKKKEKKLHTNWGGKPSTIILRHSDTVIDKFTKQRYHNGLKVLLPDITIPSEVEEANNRSDADLVYDSCAKYLISQTRDTNKYHLLFSENISYGFRRNLWGMKPMAILFILMAFCVHTGINFYLHNEWFMFDITDFILCGSYLLILLFWLFIITKSWIKIPAFAYAERLYESINYLNKL